MDTEKKEINYAIFPKGDPASADYFTGMVG